MFTPLAAQTESPIEIFDGRNMTEDSQIAEADKKFVEKEVRAGKQNISKISPPNYQCAKDSFRVVNWAEGAFTKPNIRQKVFLYQLCLSGKAQYAVYIGGVMIVEKERVKAHYIFSGISGFYQLKALPDINRNGLSEIGLEFAYGINGLAFNRAVGIYETDANGVSGFSEIEIFSRRDDDFSYKIFVKPGTTPIFYRETYKSETDKNNWLLEEKLEEFSPAISNFKKLTVLSNYIYPVK